MLEVITPPTTGDLTVSLTAQRELRLTRDEDLDGLAELIAQASSLVASYCGRPEGFGIATVRQTERITCPRGCIILDRDLAPVIDSVEVAGTALDADEWELDGGLLYRLSGGMRFPWTFGVAVVTYAAGYALLTGLPPEIERACLLTLAHLHASRGADPSVRREDNGLTSLSFMDLTGGIPPQAAQLLAPYRRIVL